MAQSSERLFPDYEVIAWLGRTTGSSLYRARRRADRAPVLLKVLEAEPATPEQIACFRREHELFGALQATALPRPLALLDDPGRAATVFEDCPGEPLAATAVPVAVPLALRLGQQLAEGLAGLHEAQLIHRDLRPANVLVAAEKGQVWLVDLSRVTPRDPPAGSAAGEDVMEGDLAYIAPEQTGRLGRTVDHRADLYSLGVILYWMLGGRLPFQASDPLGWVHCHLARTPAPLTEVAPGLPPAISDIVSRLLAKPPEDRYQSARGLAHDLHRCLSEWQATGWIEPFPPGEHDVADRLRIPRRLYGREREVRELLQSYERVVATGSAEIVLVSGYSGIGKSSLVQELYEPVVRSRGFFGSGKFERSRRDIPYSTLIQAFQKLVLAILAESEARIAAFRLRLLRALGVNAQLIVEVIPPIELVIGRQPPLPELLPTEAQNRFRITFRQFVQVFAREEHPLALFLDDLQWADSASLDLLEELVTHPDLRHLLVVGAYRDNEVSAAHPLMSTLDEVRRAGVPVSNIVLGPIPREQLAAFVGEALHYPAAGAAPLAELIHEKTAGNPFFAIHFLTALHEERLIDFEARAGAFRWDVARIRAKAFTDNVVDLMVGKLRRLPTASQDALKQLACLGHSADASILAMVRGRSEQETDADLRESARAGLVVRVDDRYRFLHDRIQEAAYSLIPPEEQAEMHLRIGRRLVARMSEAEIAERVFDVVNQWNRGASLVTDPGEREALSRLDALAGKKAKAAIAYGSARGYLAQATALLPEQPWEARYEETLSLHLALSECEYLVGNFQRAGELFDLILRNARSNRDRARVYQLRMRVHQVSGRYDQAVTAALDGLRLFGVGFPERDEELQAATQAEIAQVPVHLRGRRLADLVNAPVATDLDVRAIISLLVEAAPCAYIGRPDIFPLLAVKAVHFSLRHGNTEESCFAYSVYGLLLISTFDEIEAAFELSEMSLRLNEKFDDPRLRGTLLHLHGDHIHFWRKPFASGFPVLERAFRACLDVGDLVYAGFLAFETVWQVVERGASLDEVLEVSRRYAAFAQESHNDAVHATIRLEQQFVACLRGATRGPTSFDDDAFDEVACLATIERATFGCGIVFHHILKQILAFISGRYHEALEHAQRAAATLGAAMAMPIEATYHFFHALTLLALDSEASPAQRRERAPRLAMQERKLKLWADSCPENFHNRHALVAAELARIEGRSLDAEQLYEEAIRSAHDNGLTWNEALACEAAARFQRGRGLLLAADAYLRAARDAYLRWGAGGKVRQLERQFSQLEHRLPEGRGPRGGAPAEQLDLLTVLKASQAISGQIVLDELVETLMRVVLENAGAESGALLLARGSGLALAAVARTGRQGVSVQRRGDEAPSPAELPLSILDYVRRRREHVLLADAGAPTPFAADPYLAHGQPRSILCLPILRQSELTGLLYLENSLVTSAFTPDRLAMLELLSGQAAISLENAQLYAEVQHENGERRRAEAALRESRELMQAVIDTSTALIYVKDLEGRYLLVNRQLAAVARLDRETMLGKTDHDVFPREYADAYRAFDERVIAAGTVMSGEEVSELDDGVHTYISIKAPVTDATGRPHALCGISTDITERKRLEQELQQAQKLESIGRLAGGVAHDFNNLLTVILGHTGFVKRALGPDGPARADLEQIEQAGQRAAALTRQLLTFARRQVVEPRILDLDALVLGLGEMLRRLIGENIELLILPAQGLWLVEADPGQVEQVVVNLVVNARDAMPVGGTVTIATGTTTEHPELGPGEYVWLSVSDTGTGMSDEVKAHVFEPFYTTKEQGKGTGLGLATCYGIARQNGGRIDMVSELGKGTSFTVHLPRTHRAPETHERVSEPGDGPRGHEVVLVVEDDPRVRDFAVRVLRGHGYRVLEAADGEAALRLVRNEEGAIQVLLTDVVMPKMGGQDLAKWLRKIRPGLKVLFMSGYAQGGLGPEGELELGVALLQKPFSPGTLARRLRELLDD